MQFLDISFRHFLHLPVLDRSGHISCIRINHCTCQLLFPAMSIHLYHDHLYEEWLLISNNSGKRTGRQTASISFFFLRTGWERWKKAIMVYGVLIKKMVMSLGNGLLDQLFGGGYSPAFVVEAVATLFIGACTLIN